MNNENPLPPLPAPTRRHYGLHYSAEDMEAYARAAIYRASSRKGAGVMIQQMTDDEILEEANYWFNAAYVGWNNVIAFARAILYAAQASPAVPESRADLLLQELVSALDATNWSSWQTTATFIGELDAARDFLASAPAQEKA